VRQLLAMGRLHPAIQQYMRENHDIPQDHYLRTICQATVEAQGDAWEKISHGGSYVWHALAQALTVRRVPMEHARFDHALYRGPLTGDLFAKPEDEFALDVEQFFDLQRQWMDDRCSAMVKAGFADAVKLDREHEHSSSWDTPKGAEKGYQFTQRIEDGKLPPKNRREHLIYGVGLRTDGRVEEWAFVKKVKAAPTPKNKEEADKRKAEIVAKLVDDGAVEDLNAYALTGKGIALLEQQRRKAVAAALAPDVPKPDWDVLLAMMAVVLRQNLPRGNYMEASAPGFGWMLDEDGRIDLDGKRERLIDYAAELLAFAVEKKDALWLEEVQRFGAWLNLPMSYPADLDSLGYLKGPALQAIGKALRFDPKAYSTQKAQREAIASRLAELTPEHLPLLKWQTSPPGVRGTPMLEAASEDEDSDEAFEDLSDEVMFGDHAGEGSDALPGMASEITEAAAMARRVRQHEQEHHDEATFVDAASADEILGGDADNLGPEHAALDLTEGESVE
jgi:hypothetical protein